MFAVPLLSTGVSADVRLVRDAQPTAQIVQLSRTDECAVSCNELSKYVAAMSGAQLPILKPHERVPPGRTSIFVGTVADAKRLVDDAALKAMGSFAPNGFMIQVRSGGRAAPCVFIVGHDVPGMEFGVYDFLESLGCRWYMPGVVGEEIPEHPTLVVEDKLEVQNPDFMLRNFWWGYGNRPAWQKEAYATWRKRNKMGGVKASMGHNLQRIINPVEYGKDYPEYFPLRGNTRYIPKNAGEHGWQPCTSNPKVIEIAAQKAIAAFDRDPELYSFSLSPVDGYGWCECERCQSQDPPELRGSAQRGKGRRMTIFANEVAKRLAKKHPDRYVCWYAYAGAVEAPPDLDVHPNVIISLAHYGWCGCNIHALKDPSCKLNAHFLKILDDWAGKECKLFIREYWATLVGATDKPARVCGAYSLAEDIPFFKSKGAIGFSSESVPDYGACALNFWLAARKMWRADADTTALLQDFCEGMYGPAESTMRDYFTGIVETCRQRGCRSSFFTDDELTTLRSKVDIAAKLCATEKQRARVQLTRDSLDFVTGMRDYVRAPSAQKRQALVHTVGALRDRHSLAVDFKSFLARLGRQLRADPSRANELLKMALVPLTDVPMPSDATESAFSVRGKHLFVILTSKGERIKGRMEVRRLGRYLSGGAFALVSPSSKLLAQGTAAVGEPGRFEALAEEAGTHVVVVNTGRNAARVYADNQYFCLAGQSLALLGSQPEAYLALEPTAKQATITLTSPSGGPPDAPGETAAMVAFDPNGKEIARGDTTSGQPVGISLTPGPAQARSPWRIRIGRAPKGTLEDLTLTLGSGAAPFVATHPTRLLLLAQ